MAATNCVKKNFFKVFSGVVPLYDYVLDHFC